MKVIFFFNVSTNRSQKEKEKEDTILQDKKLKLISCVVVLCH